MSVLAALGGMPQQGLQQSDHLLRGDRGMRKVQDAGEGIAVLR